MGSGCATASDAKARVLTASAHSFTQASEHTHTRNISYTYLHMYIHHPGERAFLPAAPRLGGAGLPRRDRVRAQAAPGQCDTMLHPLTTLHLPLPRYAPLPRYILSPRCIPSPRYISLQDSASQHELHVLQLRPQAGLHTLACRRPLAMLNPLAPPPPLPCCCYRCGHRRGSARAARRRVSATCPPSSMPA